MAPPINIDGSQGINQNTTFGTKIPAGTTSQRPSSPAVGTIRINTDRSELNVLEFYDGVDWIISAGKVPTTGIGGTKTQITDNGEDFFVNSFFDVGASTFEVVKDVN